uniref:Uncharacterized protein LOC102802177 n=1 Tax=Saccoglossus kowalevskii TaxID=10224 RepID=A0ABM0M064_SACKO|nr:PREDICTED: uncharacterized protein LOC102802177 [Saccoglossus kowalevskii]
MKYTCFMQSVVSPCIIIIVVYAASVYSRLNDTEQNPFYSASNALVGQDNSVLHREWWIKQMYPNPQTFDGSMECGRRGNISWICDPNGILTAEQADSIEMDLDEIRRLTACTCRACSSDEIILGDEEYYGFTIGVALVAKIMPTMKPGDEQTDEDLTAEAQQWAEYLLHDSWKLGNCGNDAVVFISKEDNKC